jgi:hypothetical protein
MALIWKPDLQNNPLGSFSSVESVDPASRIAVVDAPGGIGGKVLRFTVKHGDQVFSGERAEVIRDPKWPEETVRFFGFGVFFPSSFPTNPGDWQVFHQYHQGYKGGQTIGRSPPIEFALNGERMSLNVNGPVDPFPVRTLWSAPLVREKWIRFVLGVRFSPTAGWLQLWRDGAEVLPKTSAVTMFANNALGNVGIYAKWGLYRKPTITPDATIYHADLVEADQLADLLPPAAPLPSPPGNVASAPVWRTGDPSRTLYVDGKLVGLVDTAELAAAIVARMNASK